MRLVLVILGFSAAVSPALAEMTACDVIRNSDVEQIVGRMDTIKGERVEMCAGWCDGLNRSYCTFSSIYSGVNVTFQLSLPPYGVSEGDFRRQTREVTSEDNYATDTRSIAGIGEGALWSFRGAEGGPEGDLEVFKNDNYHLSIQINGIKSDGAALRDSEVIARIAIARLDRMPVTQRRGAKRS